MESILLTLTALQTALDYAEPMQRALLVEGIHPILPLIWNTPYSKHIQNKLQHEQLDHFSGGGSSGYNKQQALVNMALGNQGMEVHGVGCTPCFHVFNYTVIPFMLHAAPCVCYSTILEHSLPQTRLARIIFYLVAY